MRKIYTAGPMRGIKDFNFPAFDAAERRLRSQGWVPISPAAMDRLFEGWGQAPPPGEFILGDIKRFIRRDLNVILDLDPSKDAIYMLKGWTESKGARVELALAEFLGLQVLFE